MMITDLISSKILNSRTGLIKEITQWLPEYDDPRMYVIASLVSNVEQLGLPKLGSTLNSGASTNINDAIWAAIGESLERYCSAIIPDNLTLTTYNDLKERAVHPNKFQFYSNKQYDSEKFPFQRFSVSTSIAWVEAVEIVTGCTKYVPAATVYLPYFARRAEESNIWAPVSTGLACAGNPEHAVLSGLYEVIERDAFMLFWLLGRKTMKIDWKSDAGLSHFVMKYFQQSIENIQLIDITTDINVPTVLGVYNKHGEGLLVSAATRASYVDAAKKALVELAQGRITWRKTFEMSAQVTTPIPSYDTVRTFEDHVNLYTNPKMVAEVPFLFPSQTVTLCELEAKISRKLDTVSGLANHLKKIGYESYCVNLTVDEVGESNSCVYRSLIPGLLEISNDHVWQRLGKNRISSFYTSAGDTEDFSYSPDKLNPVPHPFP